MTLSLLFWIIMGILTLSLFCIHAYRKSKKYSSEKMTFDNDAIQVK
ncbi:MAG: hypothetical protein Q4E60_09155 [Bacteroidales bacterium]|nr:hypothetical protein [Bacteroidales bacterium]